MAYVDGIFIIDSSWNEVKMRAADLIKAAKPISLKIDEETKLTKEVSLETRIEDIEEDKFR